MVLFGGSRRQGEIPRSRATFHRHRTPGPFSPLVARPRCGTVCGPEHVTVVLDGKGLSLDQFLRVSRDGERVALAEAARRHMATTRAVIEESLARGDPVYGLTTGVAERKRVRIEDVDPVLFNRRLISTHRIGQGDPAPKDVVRGALLCLANVLAKGMAGVRPELVDAVVALLNSGAELPRVRRLGSVGEADLGPMADLAHGLLEHALFEPEAGEGLALLNSNSFSVAWAALSLADAGRLLAQIDIASALDLEAFQANLTIIDPVVIESRPSDALAETVSALRDLLGGSYLEAPGAARNLQDPLTFRCIPQIQAAAREALSYATTTVERELNSSQGNPVVTLAARRVISVGNFDCGATAAALDYVRIALAPVVASASERTVKLLQAPLSGLAPGLAADPESGADGLAELAVVSQALAVEARSLAHPVSFELTSTSKAEGIEDRTSMASLSARRLASMVELISRVVAVEIVVACQAIDLRGRPPLGKGTRVAYDRVRATVPFLDADGLFPEELEGVVQLVIRAGLSGETSG